MEIALHMSLVDGLRAIALCYVDCVREIQDVFVSIRREVFWREPMDVATPYVISEDG